MTLKFTYLKINDWWVTVTVVTELQDYVVARKPAQISDDHVTI